MSACAPPNYKRLPDGVRCRCIKLFQEPDGSHWCCNAGKSDATLALLEMPSSLNDACRTMEVASDQIAALERKLAAVVKAVDDKLAQYKDISENSRGGLTELGRHAQMSLILLRDDIERALTN